MKRLWKGSLYASVFTLTLGGLWQFIYGPSETKVDTPQAPAGNPIPKFEQSLSLPEASSTPQPQFTTREEIDAQELRLHFQTGAYEKALGLAQQLMNRPQKSKNFSDWLHQQLPGLMLSTAWLRIQNKNCEDALPVLLKVQKLKRTAEASKGLAYCYHQLKQTGSALQYLDDYLSEKPDDISMQLIKVDALESESRFTEAVETLQAIKPQGDSSRNREQRIQSLLERAKQSTRQGTYETRHFHVTYEIPGHDDLLTDVVDTLELSLDEFIESFHFTAPKVPIEVILYARDDFNKAMQYGPEWAQGVFDGRMRIPVPSISRVLNDGDQLRRVLRHELVHALISQMTTGRGPIPPWLNEGLAQRFECSAPCRNKRVSPNKGAFLNVEVFKSPYTNYAADLAKQSYAQSLHLIRTFETLPSEPDSLRRMLQLIASPRQGLSSDQLLSSFQYSFLELRNLAASSW